MHSDIERETSRIAEQIVALVERTNGPVTLSRVQREVTRFGTSEPPYRCIYRGPHLFWADMTDAGAEALDNVTLGKRVAVGVVNELLYLLEGGVLEHEDWLPVALLPARRANLSAKNGLFLVPPQLLTPEHMLPSWKVLKPDGRRAH
jgi:hypothetical protein